MATYYAKIPSDVSAKQVFDAVSAEVVTAMDGIVVAAHGDERMGDFFSPAADEVFKACIDRREIFQKLADGSSLGMLCINRRDWSVHINRTFTKTVEDDRTVPNRDHYSVRVNLKSYPHIGNDARKMTDYATWLDPLEPLTGNRVSESWGITKDLNMFFRVRPSDLVPLLRKLGLPDGRDVEAFGDVQERVKLTMFTVDFSRFGFRGLYSVYSEWPVNSSTNYPNDAYVRFCGIVDSKNSGVRASVGRRNCAFQCKDGRTTRTLDGNQFDVYRTKTRRTVTVSFEQYADNDPPVRMFSSGVRKRLAALGAAI